MYPSLFGIDSMPIPPLLLNTAVAAGLGFLIGLERQLRGHYAGLRTNSLVCLGSCAFVALSMNYPNSDPTRVMSQVCTGLGFLGAGVILKDGLKIHGLTTAATVWVAGSVGCICGTGRYLDAMIVTLFVIGINLFKFGRD